MGALWLGDVKHKKDQESLTKLGTGTDSGAGTGRRLAVHGDY